MANIFKPNPNFLVDQKTQWLSKIPNCDSCVKPDIFFIVFDEYASSLSLKKNFSFDNRKLDSALINNNFYIATHSKSNYNYTPFSIGSTFNMEYFQTDLYNDSVIAKLRLQSWQALKLNRLPDIFSGLGYRFLNFGQCDFNNYTAPHEDWFKGDEHKCLSRETLWGRIEKDILWNIRKYNIPFIEKAFHKKAMNTVQEVIHRNSYNLKAFLNELKSQQEQPRFVFGHVMMPHMPFIFDRNGNNLITSPPQIFYNDVDRYLEQLMYTNQWIDSLIKATVSQQPLKRPRIVIIEGDHGFRYNGSNLPKDVHFMNLNCYYFSDHDYSLLYDSISPVNTFRVVANKYFNTQFPMLKDSCIYLK